MLATMLPAHIHQQHHVSSRPDSRASSCASSAASPTRARAHRSTKAAAVPSSSKSSTQRAQPSKAAAKKGGETGDGASVPGLITLSKPLVSASSSSSPLASPAAHKRKNKPNAAAATAEGAVARGRTPSSTPPREGEQDAAATAKAKRTKQRSKNKKGVPAALALSAEPSVSLLSQSAPSSSSTHKDAAAKSHVQMQSARADAVPEWDTPLAATAASAAMTWQQEMLNSMAPKEQTNKKSSSDASSKRDSSLTWQQTLLGQAKSTGPHFDFFADDRDIATFGSNDEQAAVGPASRTRARAGSVGNSKAKSRAPAALDDVFASSSSSPRPAHHHNNGYISDKAKVQVVLGCSSPSTPNKSKSSQQSSSSPLANAAQLGGFAYAGPNFHNSPSPASLPMPKFNTRTGSHRTLHVSHGSTSGSSSLAGESTASSSASEDEDDLAARKARGTTAPPALMSSPAGKAQAEQQSAPVVDRTATIESLLAKMMAPTRPAGI